MIRFRLKELIAEKEFRERRVITMTEVAAQTGINRMTLSKIANHPGYSTVTDNLDRLCDYFGCRLEQLAEHLDKPLAPLYVLHGNEPQATPLAYLSGARHIFKLPNNNRWNFLLSNREPVLGWDDLGHGIDQRLAVTKLAGAAGEFDRRMTVPAHAEGKAAVDQVLTERGWQDATIVAFQPGASTMACWVGVRMRASDCSTVSRSIGAVEIHITMMNSTVVTAHVHHGIPLRACMVLKKCRMVTPIRKISPAMTQLYSLAKASG